MNTLPSRALLLLVAPIALALSGCGNDPAPTAPVQAPAADAAPADPVATAPAAPTYPADYRIDEAIARGDVAVRMRLVGQPVHLAGKDQIQFQVEVFNDGKTAIVSAGNAPVRLAPTLAGPDGVDTAPGTRSFHRAMLPLIVPGESAVVTARAPVEPMLGLTLRLEPVQEGIAWWGKAFKQPTLDVGRFQRCNGAAASLCDADGLPLESR